MPFVGTVVIIQICFSKKKICLINGTFKSNLTRKYELNILVIVEITICYCDCFQKFILKKAKNVVYVSF